MAQQNVPLSARLARIASGSASWRTGPPSETTARLLLAAHHALTTPLDQPLPAGPRVSTTAARSRSTTTGETAAPKQPAPAAPTRTTPAGRPRTTPGMGTLDPGRPAPRSYASAMHFFWRPVRICRKTPAVRPLPARTGTGRMRQARPLAAVRLSRRPVRCDPGGRPATAAPRCGSQAAAPPAYERDHHHHRPGPVRDALRNSGASRLCRSALPGKVEVPQRASGRICWRETSVSSSATRHARTVSRGHQQQPVFQDSGSNFRTRGQSPRPCSGRARSGGRHRRPA